MESREGAGVVPRNGLSYVKGDTTVPLSTLTVFGLLAETAAKFPERQAVVFREQGVDWTWREFIAHVDTFAAGLVALGLKKGDRVGIWSPNRVEWLVTQFATARVGLVLVNINPAYRLAELEYAINKVGCKALVAAESFKTSRYLDMLNVLAPELAVCKPGELKSEKLPTLRTVIRMGQGVTPGMMNFSDVVTLGADADLDTLRAICDGLDCFEPINIQFTSGTTGNPKGATLTHHNIVNNGRFIAMAMRFSERDSLCIPVPFYHCFGMVLAVLACVSTGATMVFPGEAFDPKATMAAVSEESCTALHGVPTMFIAQLDHPDFGNYHFESLRTGIMAGSPCPIETMKRVISQMHMNEVTIAYGMTETSPVSFQTTTTDPLEKRVTTVGRVQPHLEVKLVDAAGEIVPVGEKGELCTKGYSVMQGYWDDEPRTREAIRDGWMHTGDLATLDEEGYCNIVGRVKDMLIRGGENIYCVEVENVLYEHPAVMDAALVPVPHKTLGEEPGAVVHLKPGTTATEEELRHFVAARLAAFKVPVKVVFWPETLPRNANGKILKTELKKIFAEPAA